MPKKAAGAEGFAGLAGGRTEGTGSLQSTVYSKDSAGTTAGMGTEGGDVASPGAPLHTHPEGAFSGCRGWRGTGTGRGQPRVASEDRSQFGVWMGVSAQILTLPLANCQPL